MVFVEDKLSSKIRPFLSFSGGGHFLRAEVMANHGSGYECHMTKLKKNHIIFLNSSFLKDMTFFQGNILLFPWKNKLESTGLCGGEIGFFGEKVCT